MVKHDAPELLRAAFDRRSWEPQLVVMSGNTDCYQPAERRFGLTRKLLEVFLEYRNPVGIITKNALVVRIDPIVEKRKVMQAEAELRIAQAQLVGWLEGLFHGIQTALVAQQMAAQAQLEQMRRRAIGPGGPAQAGLPESDQPREGGNGLYL